MCDSPLRLKLSRCRTWYLGVKGRRQHSGGGTRVGGGVKGASATLRRWYPGVEGAASNTQPLSAFKLWSLNYSLATSLWRQHSVMQRSGLLGTHRYKAAIAKLFFFKVQYTFICAPDFLVCRSLRVFSFSPMKVPCEGSLVPTSRRTLGLRETQSNCLCPH